MLTLINNTKSTSVIGKAVILDPTNPQAFLYAPPTATKVIGIVAESSGYRQKCKIATAGEKALVAVSGNVKKDDTIRLSKTTDRISLGVSTIAKSSDAPYLRIGIALSDGNSLIPCVLDLSYSTSSELQSGIVNVTSTSYTVGTSDGLIVVDNTVAVSIYLPTATPPGRVIKIGNVNTGTVTVYPNGPDTINGETSQVVPTDSCMDIQSYENNKWIIV